ncbi:MAG: hypothetical protein LBQ90_12465 [Synergistaceae bacterium]|nr:hypothetical protein [Synergistaceae bacterium]
MFDIIKILFDSRGEIGSALSKNDGLNRDAAVEGIPIPLHPGAEKYFFAK